MQASLTIDSLQSESETEIVLQKLRLHYQTQTELRLRWRKIIAQQGSSGRTQNIDEKINRDYILGNNIRPLSVTPVVQNASSASHQLTAGLQRAQTHLQEELDRSSAALLTFDKSSHTLRETLDEFHVHDNSVGQGRSLTSRLRRRDFQDRFLLVLGVMFVLLCSASIVWSRLAPYFVSVSNTRTTLVGFYDKFGAIVNPELTSPVNADVASKISSTTSPNVEDKHDRGNERRFEDEL